METAFVEAAILGGVDAMVVNHQNGAQKKNTEDIDELIKIIHTVKHGSVTVIIQDGKIVQIEKNEKVRIK